MENKHGVSTQPRIETIPDKKLIGKHVIMTFANNRTPELWRSFMPVRKQISNTLSSDLFSMQIYHKDFDLNNPDIHAPFEKWAAAEVSALHEIPEGMDSFLLPGGAYAVFTYKGAASAAIPAFSYIFGTWLPASGYELDNRPHFEIIGDKYKNEDPSSEEEIWIPVKIKG